jgi:hypothetical protein
MKKLLVTAACLVLVLSAYCQSLSVNDLEKMTQGSGRKQLLTSKAFIVIGPADGTFSTYIKNKKTNIEEQVFLAESTATYSSKNRTYVGNLLKQAQSALHLVVTDDDANYKFYRFDDKGFHVSINIPKATSLPCTVTARTK